MKIPSSFDIIGNIAILKFDKKDSLRKKKKIAKALMKRNPNIKTVVEKTGKFSGRLRKPKTKYIAGEKTKEVLYKENNCVFRFNINETYFSPRLSSERKEIAEKINKNNKVLVMFAGIAPFSIVIAKKNKKKNIRVYSVEINRKASKYAKENVKLNKLNNTEIIQGNVKRIIPKLANQKIRFDVIVMPRPQLKESFLKYAFKVSKKRTMVYYYDFCKSDNINKILEKVKQEAKKARKKIKILNYKKTGEIAPYKIRLRVDFVVV